MKLVGVVQEAEIEEIIGQVLSGAGSSRIVHTVRDSEDWVAKEGRNPPYAANRTEWQVWSDVVGAPMADRFAECRAISSSGRYLIMERLDPEIDGLEKPETPVWLKDRKASCLGATAGGHVKVLDYGQSAEWEGERAKAPTQPWPSASDSAQMGEWLKKLGDSPWCLDDD